MISHPECSSYSGLFIHPFNKYLLCVHNESGTRFWAKAMHKVVSAFSSV